MEQLELAQELISFLDSTMQYQTFLDWMEERGYEREEVDTAMGKIQNGEF